jgi:hypothetical protein
LRTPAQFSETFIQGLPDTAQLIDQAESSLGDQPAAVLTMRRTNATGVTIQRVYAIRASNGTWYALAAAATEVDFTAAAARFDAIAATMRLRSD